VAVVTLATGSLVSCSMERHSVHALSHHAAIFTYQSCASLMDLVLVRVVKLERDGSVD
jgi:hypothetical protein